MNLKVFLKRLGISLLIGAVIGIILNIAISLAPEDIAENIDKGFNLTLILIFAGIIVFSFFSVMKVTKKSKRILKILYEDVDVERYIREFQAASDKTKNKTYKFIYSMNLSIGYSAIGEYEKCIDIMLKLDTKI